MENTKPIIGIDGIWRSERLPECDRISNDERRKWGWLEGGRISSGMQIINRSEVEGRAPTTVSR